MGQTLLKRATVGILAAGVLAAGLQI